MNTEQKIKQHILINALTEEQMDNADDLDLGTAKGVDAAWEMAGEYEGIFSEIEIIDEEAEFRCGGQSTNFVCAEYSRHYECEQVAKKLNDGTYVSWTYWSGGGKHGEPDAVEWMDDAFEADCEEKQEMVTTYKFTKK